MRRFTRLTNAFSKKVENHAHMVALYTCWYNFVRTHKTLWSMEDVIALVDAMAEPARKRGPYKKRAA